MQLGAAWAYGPQPRMAWLVDHGAVLPAFKSRRIRPVIEAESRLVRHSRLPQLLLKLLKPSRVDHPARISSMPVLRGTRRATPARATTPCQPPVW